MIKVLYIPTGNTFVLPDEEAMRLMSNARGNYQVLEGGLQEVEPEVQLEPETVKELVMKKEAEAVVEEPQKCEGEEKLDYMSLTKDELMIVARKLGIACNRNNKLETIQAKVAEKLGR